MKGRFPLAQAEAVAAELACRLSPACVRLEAVGSTRRGKPTVGDLELMFCPRLEGGINLASREIQRMEQEAVITRRGDGGRGIWGPRNKFAVHVATGMPLDIFSVPAEGWFSALVSRTGSLRFCIRVAEQAARLGLKWDHARGFWRKGELLVPQSEQEVFQLCRMAWVAPRFR